MRPPKTVLDTNVLVSALLFPEGSASWLRRMWRSRTILPLVSRETASELVRVLGYPKFSLTRHEREDLLADYLPYCEPVVVEEPLSLPDCRDPFDRPFLALALAGEADVLVTGDADLLTLAPDFAVPIITLGALKERLSRRT
jgi:putative PIN family toxin of toxin-antitoxin system